MNQKILKFLFLWKTVSVSLQTLMSYSSLFFKKKHCNKCIWFVFTFESLLTSISWYSDVVAYSWNCSTQEIEAGGWLLRSQSGLYSKILSKNFPLKKVYLLMKKRHFVNLFLVRSLMDPKTFPKGNSSSRRARLLKISV